MSLIHPSWKPILNAEFQKSYFRTLSEFLSEQYETKTIFPAKSKVFSAFATDLGNVKVVILGQDPYHTPGVAHGLAFSVQNGIIPPSLANIFKEIESDTGKKSICQFSDGALPRLRGECVPSLKDKSGNLQHWADQGVLLLNTVLTVEAHRAASHRNHGWEQFTDEIIKKLNKVSPHLIFILWGRDARTKASLINTTHHKILQSPHPSPLSAHAGFFGSKPFSQTNAQLLEWGYSPIDW